MLLFTISIVVGYLLYKYVYKPTRYWKEKGVPYLKPAWPIVGNAMQFLLRRKPMFYVFREQYDEFPNERYVMFLFTYNNSFD